MIKEHKQVLDRENPFAPISYGNSLVFKTGNQGFEQPVFVNKVAPCRLACPIGVDIPRAFHKAAGGDISGALKVYLMDNPLPGVCGRVCFRPCEKMCNRRDLDDAINIRSFERFISDHGRVDVRDLYSRKRDGRVAIVGSGPAGLSAGYHLARLGYRVTVFEKRAKLGGMLRYGIPSYRLPRDILDQEIERVCSLGIQTEVLTAIGKDISWKDLDNFDAVFISIGLQSGKMLFKESGVEEHILTGLDFLAAPHRFSLEDAGLKTVIIGGGNVAMDVARTLLRLRHGKGDNIVVICPESSDQMAALEEEVGQALEEGIRILNGWAPHRLRKADGKRSSLEFFRAEVSVNEVSGEIAIAPVGDETLSLETERVIIAIGQEMEIDSESLPFSTKRGYVVADPFGKTDHPKFFAGGDAVGGRPFVAEAIASGKKGALAIDCFLKGKDLESEFEANQIADARAFCFSNFINKADNQHIDLKRVTTFDRLNALFFSEAERENSSCLVPENRKDSFDEVLLGLEAARMEREIARCFRCGTCAECDNCVDFCPDVCISRDPKLGSYGFDPDFCKGCGVCSVACPRDVIEMEGEPR